MSFADKLKRVFGLSDDEDLIEDEDKTVNTDTKPKSYTARVETPAARPAVGSGSPDIDKAHAAIIFEHVVQIFNESQPDFFKKTLDPEAQRQYLFNTLNDDIKGYISSLDQRIEAEIEERWHSEKERLQNEMHQLESRAKDIEGKRVELSQKQLSSDRQKRALGERVHDLEKQILALEAEKEQYELENKSLVNKLKVAAIYEKENEDMRTELNAMRADSLKGRTTTEAPAAPASQDNSEELERLNKAISDQTQELEQAKAQLADVQKENSELKQAKEDSDKQLAELRQQLDDAAKRIAELDNAKTQIETLKKQLEDAQFESMELKEKLDDAQAKSADSAKQLEALKSGSDESAKKLAEIKASADATAASSAKQLEEAKAEAAASAKQLEETKAEAAASAQKLEEAKAAAAASAKQLEEAKAAAAASAKQLEEAAAENASLKARLEEFLAKPKSDISPEELDKIRTRAEYADEIDTQLKEIQDQLTMFEDVKAKKDKKISDLKERLRAAEEQNAALQDKIASSTAAFAETDRQLRQKIASLSEELEQMDLQMRSKNNRPEKNDSRISAPSFPTDSVDDILSDTDWLVSQPTRRSTKSQNRGHNPEPPEKASDDPQMSLW